MKRSEKWFSKARTDAQSIKTAENLQSIAYAAVIDCRSRLHVLADTASHRRHFDLGDHSTKALQCFPKKRAA